jgi:hypothetical protein
MPLRKEMIFNVRRAVYTFAAFLSSKNNKKTTVSVRKCPQRTYRPKIKKGAASEEQLL